MGRSSTIDETFIHAPPPAVFDALIRLPSDASWWPGAQEAHVEGVRQGEGLVWRLDRGELHGRAEWWLEPFKDGTIVHYYLNVDPGERGRLRRWPSRVRRHRWAVRRGINALKDRLEGR